MKTDECFVLEESDYELCTEKDIIIKGTVAPDSIGLNVLWLDRPL
jgi:hypothetical protein